MSNNILFITGDDEVQRFVYDTLGFCYWTAAFDLILEKNGILDFEKVTQHVLENSAFLNGYDIVILSWLPDKFWKPSYHTALKEYKGLVFIEGPFPEFLEEFLGIEKCFASPINEASLTIVNEQLNEYLYKTLQGFANHSNIHIKLKSPLIETSKIPQCRWNGDEVDLCDFDLLISKIVESYAIAFKYKFMNRRYFSDDALLNLVSAFFIVVFNQHFNYNNVITDEDISTIVTSIKDEKFVVAESVALLECIHAIYQNENISERYIRAYDDEDIKSVQDAKLDVCAVSLLSCGNENEGDQTIRDIALAKVRTFINIEKFDLTQLKKISLQDLMIISLMLSRIGKKELSLEIIKKVIDISFDMDSGFFKNFTIQNGEIVKGTFFNNTPWIPLALLEHVSQDIKKMCTQSNPINVYDKTVVEKWKSSPYWIEHYRNSDSQSYVVFQNEASKQESVIFKKGRIIGFSFQILSYLVHFHTMHPLDQPLYSFDTSSSINLEIILMYLLKTESAQEVKGLLFVSHWPWKKEFCLTVRHDVDRIPDKKKCNQLYSLYASNDIKATWYWLPARVNFENLKEILDLELEVALHSLRVDKKSEEKNKLEKYISKDGYRVVGEAVHGGYGSDGWLGYPNISTAVKAHLQYTDFPGTVHTLPYFFPQVDDARMVKKSTMLILSSAFTVDQGTFRIPYLLEEVDEQIDFFIRNKLHISIVNHPDENFDRLAKIIHAIPRKGRVNWTNKQVCDWWLKTHLRDNLRISKVKNNNNEKEYTIVSEYTINNLAVKTPITGKDYNVEIYCEGDKIESEFETEIDPLMNINYIKIKLNLVKQKSFRVLIKK